jgi:hypothetical protein
MEGEMRQKETILTSVLRGPFDKWTVATGHGRPFRKPNFITASGLSSSQKQLNVSSDI